MARLIFVLSLTVLFVAAVFALPAHAEPIQLTDAQMDGVTAGSAFTALSDAQPPAFEVTDDNGRLDHTVADLRFQPSGGIAIPGGSNANFEDSVLRASGDPTFGAVVEAPGQLQ